MLDAAVEDGKNGGTGVSSIDPSGERSGELAGEISRES
jgi:hypothetical protein